MCCFLIPNSTIRCACSATFWACFSPAREARISALARFSSAKASWHEHFPCTFKFCDVESVRLEGVEALDAEDDQEERFILSWSTRGGQSRLTGVGVLIVRKCRRWTGVVCRFQLAVYEGRDRVGNIPACCSVWHYLPSHLQHSGFLHHRNHLQVQICHVHCHCSPSCCGSRQVRQQQDLVQDLTKLYMGWNWGAFTRNHGDASKTGTPALVVLEKQQLAVGNGREKGNQPIRFNKALPSSTSSNFKPAPICPSFSLTPFATWWAWAKRYF